MIIAVINGSPKGSYSITVQTVRYLQILHPEHTFKYLNVGTEIRSLEKDFSSASVLIQNSDLILFSYPVYTFLVPSQLHRFIELMKKEQLDLTGKFASQISTSKHFYDITAHRFIQENCEDLGICFVKGLSADMDDLLNEKGRKEAESFFDYLVWCKESSVFEIPSVAASIPARVPVSVPQSAESKEGNVVIVADLAENDSQLSCMIQRFQAVLPLHTTIINLRQFPFRGGCISCFNCSVDGSCIYNDGFSDLLRSTIQTAQAVVIAFSIKDHSMGYHFKLYDDRQFCNGHRTVTSGIPFGYIISGNYHSEQNLQTIIEARCEVGGNFLAGIATDETDTDSSIDLMANRLFYAVEHSYVQPANFYGVGGMKIFRDLIWLMQGMMKADHRFFKSHGQYDFPQKKRGTMLKMYLVGSLISNSKLKKRAGSKIKDGMIAPYKKVLDSAKKQHQSF